MITPVDSSEEDSDGDGSYLHPSLFAPKRSSRLEELVKVKTRPLPMALQM